jgi:hypothetical protein
MINPFDSNFIKFFLGFVLILLAGFAFLYLTHTYNPDAAIQATVYGSK